MSETGDGLEDAAAGAIKFLETGLKVDIEQREKDRQVYKEMHKGLGAAKWHNNEGSTWIPDGEDEGEAAGALEGISVHYINPAYLEIAGKFTDPYDQSKNSMRLLTKRAFLKHGLGIPSKETDDFICLEGLTYINDSKGFSRQVIKTYTLGPDGRTRIYNLSIPKMESILRMNYERLDEKVPANFWTDALKMVNGEWKNDPVLKEKVEKNKQVKPGVFKKMAVAAARLVKR